ncbi:MAG: hypothetical protein ABI612_21380 [Betaproteobacteria bacterium]
MRKLVSASIAALFAAVTFAAVAADPAQKPGRAIDDSTVKAGGDTNKPGRAIDDGTVKSGGDAGKPGRAADEEKPVKKTHKKKHKNAE